MIGLAWTWRVLLPAFGRYWALTPLRIRRFSYIANPQLLVIPLGVNEMVLAVWLIVKGFNSSAINSLSA
jgi:hypothetical protein